MYFSFLPNPKTMRFFILVIIILQYNHISAQSYTSYFTGNTTNISSTPEGGVCMMGGATEHDEAMKWFLQRADGGDVLVLRASGSNGYNDYLYSQLGVSVNSVETIVFHNSSAANESYIHDKIANAEAIWFAGGNQWNYISYWRNTQINTLLNTAIQTNNIVIGGTSAGMAILGEYYFSANNGTVTSSVALNNPYDYRVSIDDTPFLNINHLQNIVTDTHYDNPDRKGRHAVFLARMATDYNITPKGIACNEYTAVCIDENGIASVYGDYPNYPEAAYFLQANCEFEDFTPENCNSGVPLNWNLNESAIRVYKINGTNNGSNTFNLNDWKTGVGGSWENWYVNNGVLTETAGTQIDCTDLAVGDYPENKLKIHPNPFKKSFSIETNSNILAIELVDINGKIFFSKDNINKKSITINKEHLPTGFYILQIKTHSRTAHYKILKR